MDDSQSEGFWWDFSRLEEGKTEVKIENESLSKDDAKPKRGPKIVVDEKVEQDVKVDVNLKPEEKPKEQLRKS